MPVHISELVPQKFHLVGKNVAIAQRQVLRHVGHVRNCQQRHVGLIRRAAPLVRIATLTGGLPQ